VRHRYPFAAIVGQEEMKQALLIAATDPLIGGVLILGHRGTAKSTAVRALAELLPPIAVVQGCRFGCDPARNGEQCEECQARQRAGDKLKSHRMAVPIVDLPLDATEDRVAGTLDIERALRSGEKAFETGILARANRGWLYVDEVNLLDDHLVVLTPMDPAVRVEVILRRDAFDRDSHGFVAKWHKHDLALRKQILHARERLSSVVVSGSSKASSAGGGAARTREYRE
jgi:magnesium chelatase subunit I